MVHSLDICCMRLRCCLSIYLMWQQGVHVMEVKEQAYKLLQQYEQQARVPDVCLICVHSGADTKSCCSHRRETSSRESTVLLPNPTAHQS